ncbi:glycosyltransferase family 2 protein [Methylobacterium sp. P31]
MNKSVDAIICCHTFKRWADISSAIESLRRQTLRPNSIILVVDHNNELFKKASATFTDVLVCENDRHKGLSGARNSGIARATSRFIAFLDDDAVAEEDFLDLLVDECSKHDVLGATARVEPFWLGTIPRWLPRSFYWTIGCSHHEGFEARLNVRNVSGGAAVYKREMFDDTFCFSPELGRNGTRSLLSCEETDLCIRAAKLFKGARFVFVRDAVVHHRVPAARTSFHYFLQRCFFEGVSKYRLKKSIQSRIYYQTKNIMSSLCYTVSPFVSELVPCIRPPLVSLGGDLKPAL